jgi:hypothetical protein
VPQIIQILSGSVFTIAVCVAAGSVLLRRFQDALSPAERHLFAFLAGSACVQVVIFLLCAFHLAHPLLVGALGAGMVGWAATRVRPLRRSKALPPPPKSWLGLFVVLYAAYFGAYFFNALAPEVSPDGSGYHLGNVYRIWQQHGFAWNYHSIYSHMPQGMEMLFLPAYTIGGPSAAALVHFAFFSALPLLMVCYGCRFGFPRAGIFAAVLVYASPVCGLVGVSAYNDLALATLIYAVFYLLKLNNELIDPKIFFIIGLLIGECFALKYTGAVAAVVAATLILLKYRRGAVAPLLRCAVTASVVAVPWLLRNWIWVGDPVAPFLNAWFPNPYFSPSLEHGYLADLATYPGFKHYWDLPLDFALFGRVLPGFAGPVFLLAPLSLLALRCAEGRRLLLAASICAVPVAFNAAVRFLVPSLPFLAMAMGIAMEASWGVLPALAAFHALLCWPSVAGSYSAPWAWRIREIPVHAALRLEPEARFLTRRLPDYAWKEPVERLVPAGARIFTDAGRPEAYIHRELIVGYESALGYQAQLKLAAPLAQPSLTQSTGMILKRLGISYLLINDTNQVAGHLKQDSKFWGVTPVAEVNGATLYRID